jgi:hypothetical protein
MGGLRPIRNPGMASRETLEIFGRVHTFLIPYLVCPKELNIVTAVFPLPWWRDGRFVNGLFNFTASSKKGGGALAQDQAL